MNIYDMTVLVVLFIVVCFTVCTVETGRYPWESPKDFKDDDGDDRDS